MNEFNEWWDNYTYANFDCTAVAEDAFKAGMLAADELKTRDKWTIAGWTGAIILGILFWWTVIQIFLWE